MLRRLSPYWLWVLFSIPAIAFTAASVTSTDPRIFEELLHPTGEFSARFLIITMMISPLTLLFRKSGFVGWLRKNRRYFGVAAFGYAALHTIFYLINEGSMSRVIGELDRLYIWTGWVAFVIFIPLALTSMDYFQRVMGRHWKTLQRATYIAAAFTLLHWAALHDWEGTGPALVHFVPLIALETYRVWYWVLRPSRRAAAS